MILVTSTARAYLIRTDDDEEIWIPKSQVIDIQFGKDVADDESGQPVKEIKEMTIPQWLADEKGL